MWHAHICQGIVILSFLLGTLITCGLPALIQGVKENINFVL